MAPPYPPPPADLDAYRAWKAAIEADPAFGGWSGVCGVTGHSLPVFRRRGRPRESITPAAAKVAVHLVALSDALGDLVSEGTSLTPFAYRQLRAQLWSIANSALNEVYVLGQEKRGQRLRRKKGSEARGSEAQEPEHLLDARLLARLRGRGP